MMGRRFSVQVSAWGLVLALGGAVPSAQVGDGSRGFVHPHARTADERRVRTQLAAYEAGDIRGAVEALAREGPGWATAGLDVAMARLEADIRHHRRPENRLSASEDERLIGSLRAERVQLLVLFAGLHLYASRDAGTVAAAAENLNASEKAINLLYGLRGDFMKAGAVPWPVDRDSTSGGHPTPAPRSTRADWQTVVRYVERWYGAAAARLQAAVEVTLQPALLARGLQRFPDSYDLLLARGSFLETDVALNRPDASLSRDLESADERRRWRDRLRAAEIDYQRANEVTANDAEALVRLAGVRLALGRAAEARTLLTDFLATPRPTRTRYLALLFRGKAARAVGDLQAAAADYRAALGEYASATTPMLALGSLADEQGDAAESQRWVERALASPPGLDPWRVYIQGQAWQLDARLVSIRELRE
jgi:tetratricopeptide (TPR) repeat protein